MGLRVTVCGAARTVTGSRYLIESDKHRILIDAGLFQGKKELRQKNWEPPPFEPSELSAVVLTHAHIDHTGYLPLIVKRGFRGPVFCSAATKDLVEILLPDSAHLQEEEARYSESHKISKHHPPKPLYNQADVEESLKLLRVFKRGVDEQILPGVFLHANCAGHILGANILNLSVAGKRITFSGDIGRYDAPLLPDPEGVEIGDLLFCESTYGDRCHDDAGVEDQLVAIIKRVIVRGGPLIVPAFALGRSQNLLYYIAKLERAGLIPSLPVFIDSPMAVDATEIYHKYSFDFDDEAQAIKRRGDLPLTPSQLTLVRSAELSKTLNDLTGPRIVISASGMATGGRILHHLTHWLPREESTILFVGYQAEGTRGDSIKSGAESIKIFGRNVEVKAAVESIPSLSAHGDYPELLRWLRSCTGAPSKVRITHGEEGAATAFASKVQEELGWNAEAATMLEVVEV